MVFEIKDSYGAIPEGYDIEDTPESESEWRSLLDKFAASFGEFNCNEDYEFPDWHYGTRTVAVYLYNERFYNKSFTGIPEDLKKWAGTSCVLLPHGRDE